MASALAARSLAAGFLAFGCDLLAAWQGTTHWQFVNDAGIVSGPQLENFLDSVWFFGTFLLEFVLARWFLDVSSWKHSSMPEA